MNQYIVDMGETMTPEEYLHKKEQQELDRLFDEAIKEARQKELTEQYRKEKERYFANLISKFCDCEDELSICENLISQYTRSESRTAQEISDLKKTYKQLKTKYTKSKNELDVYVLNNP